MPMNACNFKIPDVKLMFYLLWMCKGAIWRGILDCDCCSGQEALQMQHRKRGTSLIILE